FGLNFRYWSPMSLGVWGLGAFSIVAFISFAGELFQPVRAILAGALGRLVEALGLVLAFFVAAYTGVLLSVSNQPVWSDGWPLGSIELRLWLLVIAGLVVPLLGSRARGLSPVLVSVLVLAGVLALRAAIIFGAQS